MTSATTAGSSTPSCSCSPSAAACASMRSRSTGSTTPTARRHRAHRDRGPARRRRLAAARRVVRFMGVGVLSTIAYVVLYLLLHRALGAGGANAAALAITAVANTAANRRLTFGVRGREGLVRHHARGAVVYLLTLGLTSLALASLHRLDPSPSRAVELAVVLVVAGAAATITRYIALIRASPARGRRARQPRRPRAKTYERWEHRGQGGARGRRHPRRRPWHRSRPGRAGRDGLRDRAQHARPALGGRPARDDRGDRRAGHRRGWHRDRARG